MRNTQNLFFVFLAFARPLFGSPWDSNYSLDLSPRYAAFDDLDLYIRDFELRLESESYHDFDDLWDDDGDVIGHGASEFLEHDIDLQEPSLYRRSVESNAFKRVVKEHSGLQVGKLYAFQITRPLDTARDPNQLKGNYKKLAELQKTFGYDHTSLLIGEVTQEKKEKGFEAKYYHLDISSIFTLHTSAPSGDFNPGTEGRNRI